MVGPTRRAACAGLFAGLAAAVVFEAPGAARATIVEADDYDAFWLWAGVRPQPVLARARRLYLLASEVTAESPARLLARRQAVPHLRGAEVWLVVRAGTLAWTPDVYAGLSATLTRWRAAGSHVVGVQVDFDARTRHLADYAGFLADLRRRLPDKCKLGITGLLDWSANGDPAQLAALAGRVDEMVVQIYQGRHVIPGYETYVGKLGRLEIPFRIGLLQGGDWRPPADLARNPRFEGYVVFLRNARGTSPARGGERESDEPQ